MPALSERRRGPLAGSAVSIVLVLLAVLAGSASAGPAAHAARGCSLPGYPGLGYFTSLSVSGTSCSTGNKVAVAYYRCRTRHSASGRCHQRVLGFSCYESGRRSIPTEIDARVTCSKGSARVVHTYQQNI